MKYYILSLTHNNPEALLWFRPNNSGYTMTLNDAGQYDADVVEAKRNYYDNKKETAAIPCSLVDEFAVRIVRTEFLNLEKFANPKEIKA